MSHKKKFYMFYVHVHHVQHIDKSGVVEVEASSEEEARKIIRKKVRPDMFKRKRIITDPELFQITIDPFTGHGETVIGEPAGGTPKVVIPFNGAIQLYYRYKASEYLALHPEETDTI